jgi:16S rRNA (guanine(966)-N(2))-methyltransferase RsmD
MLPCVRVIAGTFKGRRLQAPPGLDTRPTADRVREALFSILGPRVEHARVLDLFAGSGALGIEALSRGARAATFVDSAAPAVRVVAANLDAVGAEAEVVRAEARRFLGGASRSARQYDLVFLDPPYRLAASFGRDLSAAVPAVLAPEALVVVESDRRSPLEIDLPLEDERRYGDTLIRIHGPR